jgi:outer membrane receptor for monomeric catechols
MPARHDRLPATAFGLVPLNTFTMWNKYQFTPNVGRGLGVIHYDDFFATSDDTVKLKAFTRVDAVLLPARQDVACPAEHREPVRH